MTVPPDRGVSRRSFLKGSAVVGIATTGLDAAAGAVRPTRPASFGPGEHEIALLVNGSEQKVKVETRTTLLDALRDGLDLTGAKKICDRGSCGGCTVLMDGQAVNACLTLAMDAVGSKLTTVESLTDKDTVHPLVQNFVQCDAMQCGFCTPGMVMTAVDFLNVNPDPTEEEVREAMSAAVCRCTGYQGIVDAVLKAAAAQRAARA